MNSILVTGSSGFIGRKVLEKLPKLGVITDYDNSIRIDLQNINEVMKINSADIVIHLAGKTPKKKLEWNDYFNGNISSTLNILEYCVKKNVKKLIYVSNYIYGNPKYSPIDEIHPINPHNAYSESKYLAERLCKFYCDKSNISLIILRPFNIYGESMNENFLLSNLINSIKTDQKMTIVNKDSRRDFLHVDDLVDLILKIKDYNCKFEIFNAGTGISFSFNEIIEKIEKITSKKLNLEYLEDKKIFINDIKADITKIKEKLDWKPKIGIDEGLKKMLKNN